MINQRLHFTRPGEERLRAASRNERPWGRGFNGWEGGDAIPSARGRFRLYRTDVDGSPSVGEEKSYAQISVKSTAEFTQVCWKTLETDADHSSTPHGEERRPDLRQINS